MTRVPLKRVADIQYGWTAKANPLATGPKMLRITDIQAGSVAWNKVPRCELPANKVATYLLSPGDIVFARIGATTGKSYLIGTDVPDDAVYASYLIRVRPHSEILLSDYLAYFFQSADYWAHIRRESRGIGRPAVNGSLLGRLLVPVPTLEEQREVAERLRRMTGCIDGGARLLTGALDGVEQLARVLLERCWTYPSTAQLSDLLAAPMKNGRSVTTATEGFRVLRLTALRSGRVDTSESKIGNWDAAAAKAYVVEQGDFLVARGNGSLRLVGRGGLVATEPPPVAFPDTLIRIRVDESRMLRGFLQLAWDSPRVREQIEARAHTSAGIYKVNQDMLRDIELPLPPVEAQRRLLDEMHSQIERATELQTSLIANLKQAKQLTHGLIHQAFSGTKIVRTKESNARGKAVA
jgi:type I restriction enzyme S subunit